MKDDRLLIPVDRSYLEALGEATYAFSRLEWIVVHCGEKVQPGYIGTVSTKTAGRIARDVVAIAGTVVDAGKRTKLESATNRFLALVDRRNDLMHANACTDLNGEQRLSRHGAIWSLPEIQDLADEFAACEIELGHIYHLVI